MNLQSVMTTRQLDRAWRDGVLAVAGLLSDGRLDRSAVLAVEARAREADDPAVRLLALARGVDPQALIDGTLAADRVLWILLLESAGLVGPVDVPTEADAIEAFAIKVRDDAEELADDLRALGGRTGDRLCAVQADARSAADGLLAAVAETESRMAAVMDPLCRAA